VATAYKNVTPSFVQTGVNNFFGNLSDAWSAINNLLQGKGEDGMSDVTRFALNSTLGIAGLFDIASEAGLQKHNEDFGQTLGVWGVSSGPYLMLPLLGPSTVRDTAPCRPISPATSGATRTRPTCATSAPCCAWWTSVLTCWTPNLLEDAALDRYEFIRDGYLQRRESQIHPDGDGPRSKASKDESADAEVKPAAATTAAAETSAPVSSESAPKELNSGTPAANKDSL
jgi:phospholipid-binding lipoprotein MlaA